METWANVAAKGEVKAAVKPKEILTFRDSEPKASKIGPLKK
jgi:hypothetical protein